MDKVDIHQLPIPEWSLHCPRCGYALNGLPAHVCPECGLALEMERIVQTSTRLRAPRYNGAERPLPDFGFRCLACDAALAGAADDTCPRCSAPFDLRRLRPAGEWFSVSTLRGGPFTPATALLLRSEQIPFEMQPGRTLADLYGGARDVGPQVLAPSEFFLEICAVLARLRADGSAVPWACGACGEESPAHFELCWNCGGARTAA